jgi:hypothetical protein
LYASAKDGKARIISFHHHHPRFPMPLPTHVLNEIARLMRDPDALRHERERMPPPGRRGHYDPNQPRVPAGESGGGQWTDVDGTNDDSNHVRDADHPMVQPARFPLLRRPIQRTPNRQGTQRGIEAALALYAALSARNSPEQRAVFDFNAREFLRDPQTALDPRNVKQLAQRDVENVCKKLDDIQGRTDRIAGAVRTDAPNLNAPQFGTAVHTRVAHEINEPRRPDGRPKNPDYRAEVSYWKMQEEADAYGKKDSIRIDVLENAGRGLVCVYDIKTGQSRRSGLTFSRMKEIAENVLTAYPHVQRVIITEVRPRR